MTQLASGTDAAESTAAPARRHGPPSWRRALVPVGVVALLVAVPYLTPGYLSFLIVMGIFFFIVLGLDVFLGQAGQVSLGQTLFVALGAYGAGVLSLRYSVPTVLAMAIMAVVSAALAYLLGRLFLRLRGYYLSLATLGLAVITASLANGLGDITGGPSGLVGIPNIGVGSFVAVSDTANYYVVLVVCVLGSLFVSGLLRSQTGRALAAVSSDQQAASMLGINPARYKTTAFMVAAVFASIGGSLYGFYSRFVSPDMVGVLVALNLVVMLALGGSRTIVGPLLGVFLLQILPEAGQSVAAYEPLLAGVVLVIVITYLPQGLWGGVRTLVQGWFRP
ncbi:MAG: branched-chain amino acid ABC transporter permease [Blastococcus sp.]